MGTRIASILIALAVVAAMAVVLWVYKKIFSEIVKEMTDDGRPKTIDGTEEWKKIKEILKVNRLKTNSLQPKQLNSKRN